MVFFPWPCLSFGVRSDCWLFVDCCVMFVVVGCLLVLFDCCSLCVVGSSWFDACY